jgi:hypothetical protein
MALRPKRVLIALGAVAVVAAAVAVTAISASAAGSVTATFSKDSDWGTGYQGKYTIINGTSASISAWTVAFDLPTGTTMGTYWDTLITVSGQHVVAKNREYNGTVAPGGSATFGFVVSGSGSPTHCTVNGGACTGGPAPSPTTSPTKSGAPGAPGGLKVTGTTASSISLSWTAPSGTVTGYRVYQGSTVKATVTGTTATVTGLAACSSHTYTVAAYNSAGESARSGSATGVTSGCPSGGGVAAAAPYLYFGWGDPPAPTTVMGATGVKWFTLAFMLSGGGCTPKWDSQRPLTGGVDQQNINAIRAAGGDVTISFGGWQGTKLGPNCSSASALAGAYQTVINTYKLKAIDIDIENTDEFESATVQDRILGALKIVKQNNPGIRTIVTFGTSTTGPTYWGGRLIDQAKALGANIDVFTQMPFDFGGGSDMAASTKNATEGLKTKLMSTFGWSAAVAYTHIGISSMNGITDSHETVTPAAFQSIRDYAQANHLARLSFWSVNRDRPCPGGGVVENCSGIAQNNWQFTKINATFTG